MRSALIGAVFLLIFQSASGEIPIGFEKVLKKANPNELLYNFEVDPNCPVSEKEIEDIVDGAFIRSGIKPLGEVIVTSIQLKDGTVTDIWPQQNEDVVDYMIEKTKKNLYLSILLGCQDNAGSIHYIFNLNVYFGDGEVVPEIWYSKNFGAFGVAGADFMRSSLKDSVEKALTVYMEVNFDL